MTRRRNNARRLNGSRLRPDLVVQNSERLAAVSANGVSRFSVAAHVLPWLRNIGVQYERYKFRSFVAQFVSSAPSTAVGTVALAYTYDPYPGMPANITSMEQMRDVSLGPAHSQGFYKRGSRGKHSLALRNLLARPTYVTSLQPMLLNPEEVEAWLYFGSDVPSGTPGFIYVTYVCELFSPISQAFPRAPSSNRHPPGLSTKLFQDTKVSGENPESSNEGLPSSPMSPWTLFES